MSPSPMQPWPAPAPSLVARAKARPRRNARALRCPFSSAPLRLAAYSGPLRPGPKAEAAATEWKHSWRHRLMLWKKFSRPTPSQFLPHPQRPAARKHPVVRKHPAAPFRHAKSASSVSHHPTLTAKRQPPLPSHPLLASL